MIKYLESGVIATTHGIRGEMKMQPWSDGPEFIQNFSRVFIDGHEYKLVSARIQKSMNIIKLEGIDDIDQAMRYRGKVVSICRDDIDLEEGRYFVQDLIGLSVYDRRTEKTIGKLAEVNNLPAGDIYVIRNGEQIYMIPVNPVFVKETDMENGIIYVETIKGMLGDE